MNVPEELRYSTDHEWVRLEGGRVRIGITDYAQDALGDVVFVQVPEVGTKVAAGGGVSEVESTKSVSDIYAPVGGTVVEVNDDLADAPERVNEDPYGDGWICVIEPDDPSQLDQLLDADAYRKLIDGMSAVRRMPAHRCRQPHAVRPDRLTTRRAHVSEVYCNNCGHRNPTGSNFCSSCGGPLEPEQRRSTRRSPPDSSRPR